MEKFSQEDFDDAGISRLDVEFFAHRRKEERFSAARVAGSPVGGVSLPRSICG